MCSISQEVKASVMFHNPDAVTFSATASPTVRSNIVVKFEAVEFGETVVPSNLCSTMSIIMNFNIEWPFHTFYDIEQKSDLRLSLLWHIPRQQRHTVYSVRSQLNLIDGIRRSVHPIGRCEPGSDVLRDIEERVDIERLEA